MSAYIVEHMSICRIVNFMRTLKFKTTAPLCYMSGASPFAFDDGHVGDVQARCIGTEMLRMNEDAVRARYGKCYADGEPSDHDELSWCNVHPEAWQTLKSLSCYLYQCSEGDIPKRELFKKLKALHDKLGLLLVQETAQYNAAKWG